MKKKTSFQGNRSGMTLVVVMVMTLLCAAAASSVLYTVGARMQRAQKQVDFEKAFYIAEAGLERVAAVITTGNEVEQPYRGNIGGGSYEAKPVGRRLFGNEKEIVIKSVGRYNGTECRVAMYGVRGVSWARYALWYNVADPTTLVFSRGESFRGRVYSTPKMIFYNNTDKVQTHFYDKVWTHASSSDVSSGAVPVFDMGIVYNADKQQTAEVDLAELKAVATEIGRPNAFVLVGDATIVLDKKRMRVTNKNEGWINKDMAIPANGLVYAAPRAPYTESQYLPKLDKNGKVVIVNKKEVWEWRNVTITELGDISVAAPTGLDGQLTLVAENNINIIDHVVYAVNPQTTPTSDDKLGLIAKNDAIVKVGTPNNLNIYAHIFCKIGGFGVESHGDRGKQGMLNVYGGIANEIRKAVGYTDGRGYFKNYAYDVRFARDPPPHYPRQPEELEWDRWEDRWEE